MYRLVRWEVCFAVWKSHLIPVLFNHCHSFIAVHFLEMFFFYLPSNTIFFITYRAQQQNITRVVCGARIAELSSSTSNCVLFSWTCIIRPNTFTNSLTLPCSFAERKGLVTLDTLFRSKETCHKQLSGGVCGVLCIQHYTDYWLIAYITCLHTSEYKYVYMLPDNQFSFW